MLRASLIRGFVIVAAVLVLAGMYQRLFPTTGSDVQERLATTRDEIAEIGRALDATVAKAEDYEQIQRARQVFVSEFALTAGLKVAMSECYMSNGEWPLDGCGMELSDFQGSLLERVSVEAGGSYLMHFKAGLGLPSATVRMRGEANSAMVRWHCSSPDYEQIGRLIPDCKYDPGNG